MDQPVWVHRLFNRCALWDEFLTLKKKLPPPIPGKSFDDD